MTVTFHPPGRSASGKNIFRKLNHNCHVGDHLARQALRLQLGVMVGKGEKKWRKPMVRQMTAILLNKPQHHHRVPLAEGENVPQK